MRSGQRSPEKDEAGNPLRPLTAASMRSGQRSPEKAPAPASRRQWWMMRFNEVRAKKPGKRVAIGLTPLRRTRASMRSGQRSPEKAPAGPWPARAAILASMRSGQRSPEKGQPLGAHPAHDLAVLQ